MSAEGKEYRLAIKIAGMVDRSFGASLNSVKKELSGLEKARRSVASWNEGFSKMDAGFDWIGKAGMACFSGLAKAAGAAAAAVGAAAGVSVNTGMEFESAFAGVKKTVDATDEEYGRLRENILGMAREMPSGAAEIAGVMEIAGQLGIAGESLAGFTETMINMGVSTNLSSEEASTSLAKFANIVSMADYGEDGISNWERLGSVVVDLGNHFATTEADIVEMATRLASAGELVGLTEAQIMALATSMSSVGIGEEAGGSSMSKLLRNIQIATELGSESLEEYASVAGMTAAEFTEVFQEDAVKALSAFIDGLNDTERNGKSAIVILDDLGMNEIRLSNTVLSLASANGVMSDAIQTANAAWGAGTALADEAGKRYETAESRVRVMKNAFQELGISAYEELRGPFVDSVGTVTDKVAELNAYISSANGLKKWMGEAEAQFPTLQRKFRKFAQPVFSGIMDFGKWTIRNGKGIISVIEGVGATFAAYKIASTVTRVTDSLLGLTKGQWAVSGVMAAVGGLAAAYSAYKQHERELVDQNLADHFGDITLSMEELQKAAEHIVSSESLGGVKKAMEAFGDLDDISAAMQTAASDADRLNWKISIGMELTEEENGAYRQAIDEYVKAAQGYVEQAMYAVSIGLEISSGDEGTASKIMGFYSEVRDEAARIGGDLNEAMTEAFNDGLLEPDEMEIISNLRKDQAEAMKAVAIGDIEAEYAVLGEEFSGKALDAESMKNLMERVGQLQEQNNSAYLAEYKSMYSAAYAAMEAGAISRDEFDEQVAAYQSDLWRGKAEGALRAAGFLGNTLTGAYWEEIAAYQSAMDSVLSEYASRDRDMDWETRAVPMWDGIAQGIFRNGPSDTSKKALEEMLDASGTVIDSLYELKDGWDMLSPEMREAAEELFGTFGTLRGMTARDRFLGTGGDLQGLYQNIADEIMSSDEYGDSARKWVDQHYDDLTGYIKTSAAANIEQGMEAAKAETVQLAVDEVYAYSDEYLQEVMSQGFQATADVEIALNPILRGSMSLLLGGNLGNAAKAAGGFNSLEIDRNADGGIIRNRELSWLAEKGPEAVIPLDGSRNAISLWETAGRLMGMENTFDSLDLGGGSGEIKVEYSPVLNFYGAAPGREDLTEALEISQEKFDRMIDMYFKTRSRVSFG